MRPFSLRIEGDVAEVDLPFGIDGHSLGEFTLVPDLFQEWRFWEEFPRRPSVW